MAGTAEVREQTADVDRVRASIRRAYPFESRVFLSVERLLGLVRRRPHTVRAALYIDRAP